MNENRVKNAFRLSPNCMSLVEKFLNTNSGTRFSYGDICWWWNEDENEKVNRFYARKFIRVLLKEKAIIKIWKENEFMYTKSEELVVLLEEMQMVDEMLKAMMIDA